ncbi:MAG TPA: hypothetical protein VG838_11940 [Opitutaceae bacterium]|nr:hypothetical protein [Opitutaceae bacterium]
MLAPLVLLVGLDAVLVRRLAADRQWMPEIIALLGAQLVALWLTAPYFTSSLVGAADSFSYSLVLADFIEQLRHGIFPVFVGQSASGFNGNIHLIRDAPYFLHLGAALNLLTGGQLSAFALQNLCLIASVLGGATTTFVAVRMLAPAWRWAATLLAALYVLCPAIMVLLAGMDMHPSIMTLPWLPLFWLGVAGSLTPRDDTRSLVISTGALALVWYGHPAIAAWLTPFWLGAFVLRWFFIDRTFRGAVRAIVAGGALGWLISYLFISVSSMQLHYSVNPQGAADRIFQMLHEGWVGAWRPLSEPAGQLGNIQLGYALEFVILGCLLKLSRNQPAGWFFAAVLLVLQLLLVPVPGITPFVWSLVPAKLIDATNIWPMQRFYLIIPAAIPVWAALALSTWPPGPRLRRACLSLLAAGVAWSAWQEKLPRSRARLVTRTHADSVALLQPVNLTLARGAYLFFGFRPSYFSNGVMEPAFESRLLDPAMQPMLDNASALARLKSGAPTAVLVPRRIATNRPEVKRREATFSTDGRSGYLLAFAFDGIPAGGIELFGAGGLNRHYDLPLSGEPRGFGAGAQASPYLPLSLPPGPAGTITLRTEVSGISARVYAFRPEELPLQTDSLIPLTVRLDAPQAGLLETPRVFIPGYAATVNGVPSPVISTRERLVGVAVPAGPVRVVVSYVAPAALRVAFWFSLAGFALLPLLGGWLWARAPREISLPPSG